MSAVAQGGTTQYIYDANGRLSAVIAPNGGAAIYRYDAAGNLTGIDQVAAGDLSILSFAPTVATIGDSVVLTGTGLDTVSTVSFNGVPGQIVSSAPSSLTAIVPGTATSGPITVSGVRGSFTSADPLTVVARVDVAPSASDILPNETIQFEAVVVGTSDQNVTWSVNGIAGGDATVGTISSNGLFTAPNIDHGLSVTIAAASEAAASVTGQAAVRILNPETTSELRSFGLVVSKGVSANNTASAVPVSVARSDFTNDFVGSFAVAVAKGTDTAAVARPIAVEFGPISPLISLPVSATTGPVITAVAPAALVHGTSGTVTVSGSNLLNVTSVSFLKSTGAPDANITVSNIVSSPDGGSLTFTASLATTATLGTDVIQVTTQNGPTQTTNLGNNVVQIQ